MRIVIATDAWLPQVNGVVRTLQAVTAELHAMGHLVSVIGPDQFRSLPCPSYPEIRLAMTTRYGVGQRIANSGANAIHIATEGPIGIAARAYCLANGLPFTTAYHTQFPEYLAQRTQLPAEWFWHYIRWFHGPSSAVLASTPSVVETLGAHGVGPVLRWGRGVDFSIFRPDRAAHPAFAGLPRPIQLYVGRIAVEKNIGAFLGLGGAGTKVVVGDGPARAALERQYPDAVFLGMLGGETLASAYAGADVFVFPSRTDTFGLVMIEALACGTPVAAFPVSGPIDVLDPAVAAMDDDLAHAVVLALTCDRAVAADFGASFGWRRSAEQFLSALVPIDDDIISRWRRAA
ncbi:Glycosyltransferase involved in cell wall bisynthesis [Sphingomonas sp. YR710]|uniref:glycosyltransferase family 4 protein n=1 Tax=Sphingomonas sp. YR710 TaxID=1882773 RepID=UPI0008873A2D|nr:glycosyltransferase family 1 protein [Sphingomonas sp. YR710]SDD35042.1 Glycosyltransferase involved in cell wall bisynthesis [Sphingomonas sp. YR710]